MKSKKLLVFHPALAPYRIDFFNNLDQNFTSTFYFSKENLDNQKFNQLELRKRCSFTFNLLNRGFEIGGRYVRVGIWGLIRKHKPDMVLCSEYSQITIMVILFKLIFLKNLKVFTISDDSKDLSIKRSGIRRWIRNRTSKYLNGVIFPSQNVCDWYRLNVNSETPLFSLPIIHENQKFREKIAHSKSEAKKNIEKYKLHNQKVFIYVGRLVKEKNIIILLKAFSKISNSIPDMKLVIIGEGDHCTTIKKEIEVLNLKPYCILTGKLEGNSLYSWYSLADCLVLPSIHEPYGAVVNEALLAGTQVICSKLAGASELITDDNGILFQPDNILELQEALMKIYYKDRVNNDIEKLRADLMPFELNAILNNFNRFLNDN